ncbi:hypothetical protein B0681_08120 [Moraxella porci DSM 25326]|uniref:3-oxoacyl-ACP synthase n=1 Tax=Moraxella porci DSM 25326 TaxID=573983 RepID=A0A1T0CNL1_9GAMM|nr:BrnA antitoxin family protein [Moraxella porci]OOS23918.1 hypothetical protein B0681_08120 [Moraxella porci DSM 25326]
MTEKLRNLPPLSIDDAPELDDAFFERADMYHGNTLVRQGRPRLDNPKQATTIRLDADVLEYFKAGGKGWQTRLNLALREYIATH